MGPIESFISGTSIPGGFLLIFFSNTIRIRLPDVHPGHARARIELPVDEILIMRLISGKEEPLYERSAQWRHREQKPLGQYSYHVQELGRSRMSPNSKAKSWGLWQAIDRGVSDSIMRISSTAFTWLSGLLLLVLVGLSKQRGLSAPLSVWFHIEKC